METYVKHLLRVATTTLLTLLCCITHAAADTTGVTSAQSEQESPLLDQYGGSTAMHFDDGNGAGFFRTKHHDGRWWLVTPANNAFLSFGLNHFHANLWAKDYNKRYWERRFKASADTDEWSEAFSTFAVELMHETGSNTFGYHTEYQLNTILSHQPPMPHIRQYRPLNLSSHLNPKDAAFVDIFAPSFRSICERAARVQVAPYKDDPYTIGFAMSDVPTLTQTHSKNVSQYKYKMARNAPTWPQVLRNMGTESKGKQRYVEFIRERYGAISDFNVVYSTTFASWDSLLASVDWRPKTDFENEREMGDNNEFGKLCINQYYRVAAEAFREADPNHLFLGDKINANLRDIDELALVAEQISKHVDVILIQYYGTPSGNDKVLSTISRVADIPIINGDGGFGAAGDPKMPHPQTPTAKDQTQRAEWFIDYASNAFAHPNFVGYHICGVVDGWNSEGTQKPGIINPLGAPHKEVIKVLKTISSNLYNYHNPGSKSPSIRQIMERYYDADTFVVGASGRTEYLSGNSDKLYQRWLTEFSYNTPENNFKQSTVYPQPNAEWRSDNYQQYIQIARDNNQIIRAHGPISPQCSAWVKDDTRTPQQLEQMLRTYISRLCTDLQEAKDVVKWMDVVNETFACNRQMGIGYDASQSENSVAYEARNWAGPRKGTTTWENPWTLIGFDKVAVSGETITIPRYIRLAFEEAQEHAPDIKKIYNTHGKEIDPLLWKKLGTTILYLRSRGLRVDGIGWQAHLNQGWERSPKNIKNLRDAIAWCHQNDLEFHITELDVATPKGADMSAEIREAQAATIGAIVEVMLQNINNGARGVNFWTMAYRTHNGQSYSTLFDLDANPLPAYYRVKELLLKYAPTSTK